MLKLSKGERLLRRLSSQSSQSSQNCKIADTLSREELLAYLSIMAPDCDDCCNDLVSCPYYNAKSDNCEEPFRRDDLSCADIILQYLNSNVNSLCN